MIKIFILCSVLILTFASDGFSQSKRSSAAKKVAAGQSKLIGLVGDDKSRNISGCGCYLKPASTPDEQRYYFLTVSGDDGFTAWMNIDGRDVKLSLESTTARPEHEHKGDTTTEVYKGGGATVQVILVITEEIPPGGKIIFHSADIKVTKGKRTQTVKAVGDCGC